MVNVNKLRGKIVERGLTVTELAEMIELDRTTLYRKLNSEGKKFTIEEADAIAKALQMTASEVNSIFFSQYVA